MFNGLLNAIKLFVDQIFLFTNSYALSVIIFTFIIKFLLLPLEIKQRKSSRAMIKIGPKVEEINKRYANDPDKKAQKTMELYKKEKVSMFSSCLPLLIQMPILFMMVSIMNRLAYDGMMQMFLDAYNGVAPRIERFLWVANIFQPDNLTAPVLPDMQTMFNQIQRASSALITDETKALLEANYATVMAPYLLPFEGLANGLGILPILSGGLQFLQTRLTPQPTTGEQGKNQKMMMYIFPIMSVVFCWTFNASFALYWVSSSVFAIIQTLILNRYYKNKDAKEAAEGVLIT